MSKLFKIASVGFLVVAVLSAVVVLQVSAYAQDEQANVADPPSRVARLSYLNGDVSFQPNGVDDWVTATLNRPLTTSDRLWTARDSRAELQTGNATMRLNSETSFTLANLDDQRVQIQIAQGVLNVRLRQLDPSEAFEIDTPNLTLNLLRAGEYRIEVDNENDVSFVTVRSGSAEVTGGAQAMTVQPGQEATFSGNDGAMHQVNAARGPDGFDQWCSARDRRADSARSAQYVSRNVIGYEDLDQYGTWQPYGDYGMVWVPAAVSVGWAPYRYGHWAWIYPWGWTWVDDAPWGFAPFHYGRWVHAGFGWAWVPGPIYARPVYAPALVAWFGGSGFSVGMSFGGGVGWFALGPREPFIPWYWGSQRYFSRVNYTNTRITNVYINNYYNNYYRPNWGDHDHRFEGNDGRTIAHIDYANRHAPNGMTFVDHDSFVNGRNVSRVAMRVPTENLRNAPVLTNINAKPERTSVLGEHGGNARFRPPQTFDRPFVSRSAAPKSVPFETQAKTTGRPQPTSDVRTRTFGNGAGGMQSRSVPRPPERAIGNQQRPAVIADSRAGRPSVPANNPRWAVPRPPDTTGRGVQNQRQASNTPWQRVPADNSGTASRRDVYRPSQVQRPQRNVNPSPSTPTQPRPPQAVQQHSERPTVSRANPPRTQQASSPDRGGRRSD